MRPRPFGEEGDAARVLGEDSDGEAAREASSSRPEGDETSDESSSSVCVEAFGVELARSRHHAALQSLQCEPVNVSCRVTLLEGDCAAQDLWQAHLSSVGVVFVSNLLFDASLNQRLKHCIEQHAPQARAVACLRKWSDTLEGYMEPFEVLCETSWTAPILLPTDATWSTARGSKVFIYKRIL